VTPSHSTAADEGFVSLFRVQARAAPERVYARFDGTPLSFGALQRRSDAFAATLASRGIGRGERVAVMLRNSADALAVMFGLAKAGAVWVPVNARQRGEGLRYILEHAAPRLVIAEADLVPVIRDSGAALGATPLLARDGAGGDDSAAPRAAETALEPMLAPGAAFASTPPRPEDIAAIMYTSGTTGRPKGVLVTHRMLRLAGEGAALVSAARDGDVLFVWEPLYHIGGAQLILLPLLRDVSLAFVERFSASRFWEQVRDCGATQIHYLGGILQMLLKQPPGPRDRDHGVRIAWGGGCPAEIWTEFERRFGVVIRECYGMTEASSFTTCNDSGVVGAVGRPLPWLSVAVLDEAGTPVAPGERGEIVVRAVSPGALTPGYYRDPEATAAALRDGALHTGDLGSFDAEGNLRFHGRLKDCVRCKGENVSAWEVEHVAAGHPAVEDCAMIGVAAEIGESDIKLFVRPKPGMHIDPAALSQWLGARLAPYQNPRYIAIVEAFERTPSQRIMKHRLSTRLDDAWDRLRS